jgi:hypothetical protein
LSFEKRRRKPSKSASVPFLPFFFSLSLSPLFFFISFIHSFISISLSLSIMSAPASPVVTSAATTAAPEVDDASASSKRKAEEPVVDEPKAKEAKEEASVTVDSCYPAIEQAVRSGVRASIASWVLLALGQKKTDQERDNFSNEMVDLLSSRIEQAAKV